MAATNTADRMRKLQKEADVAGGDHGWAHAVQVDTHGGVPYAEPDVPSRFATVADVYSTSYEKAVAAYFDE